MNWRAIAAALLGAMLLFAPCRGVFADASSKTATLVGKLIMGYQGWFACPGDAAGEGWLHWFSDGAPTVDMLPDVSELSASERCHTSMIAADGRPVDLFSSQNPATVERHFRWMQQYGLDGVALQRFATQLADPPLLAAMDTVLANVRGAAEHHDRIFFLMYDLSGMPAGDLRAVALDWQRLERQGLTQSAAYLRHRGRPLLGLWGLGFADRPMTPQDASDLLAELARVSAPFGGVTALGGVPAGWRTGDHDAAADPGWRRIWPLLGVISPWSVGRYADEAGADAYRFSHIVPDLQAAAAVGADYMPVVFPGFSWSNLMRARQESGPVNQIPRGCGRFYWRQVFNARSSGASMIYGAMFDEVDEGTAMFKLVASASDAPQRQAAPSFVTLDADGCRLPSDWYLRLAGAAAAMLRGQRPLSPETPLEPPH
jgi:hypothetical protein